MGHWRWEKTRIQFWCPRPHGFLRLCPCMLNPSRPSQHTEASQLCQQVQGNGVSVGYTEICVSGAYISYRDTLGKSPGDRATDRVYEEMISEERQKLYSLADLVPVWSNPAQLTGQKVKLKFFLSLVTQQSISLNCFSITVILLYYTPRAHKHIRIGIILSHLSGF